MRRLIAISAMLAAVQLSAGCRHVGGACDCENGGKQGSGCGCGCNGRPTDTNPAVCGYYNGSYHVTTCGSTPPPPPPPAQSAVRSTVYQPMPQ